MGKKQGDVVWGVEFGGSAVRLVRLERTGSQGAWHEPGSSEVSYQADRYLEVLLDERWETAPSLVDAAGRMGPVALEGPLGACVGDEMVLYRVLSLPAAEPEALARMVRGQLEVLVPTQVERFAAGYRGYADPYNPGGQRVLMCAARLSALAAPVEASKRLGGNGTRIVPSVLALAAMWARLGDGRDGPATILDVGARCTSLAVVDAGEVVQCGVIDQGGDHWTERLSEELGISCQQAEARKLEYARGPSGAEPKVNDCLRHALGGWARQLKEAYGNCLETVPRRRWPGRCFLFGRSSRMPGLPPLVAETLRAKVETPESGLLLGGKRPGSGPGGRLTLGDGVDLTESAGAIAAALCVMESDWPVVGLRDRIEEKPRRRRHPSWRWAALVGWLFAAVFGLYVVDKIEAKRLSDAVEGIRTKVSGQGDLGRQLAIGDYLETIGSPPLDVLERISQAVPEKALLASWVYDRRGEMVIEGTVPNEKEFLAMLDRLRQAGELEWKSGRPDKGKFHFDIHLQVGARMKPVATGLAPPLATKPKTMPTTTAATGTRPTAKASTTQPATGPQGGAS